jgi:hypothetical protein
MIIIKSSINEGIKVNIELSEISTLQTVISNLKEMSLYRTSTDYADNVNWLEKWVNGLK